MRTVAVEIAREIFPTLFIPWDWEREFRCTLGLPPDAMFERLEVDGNRIIAWFETGTEGPEGETVRVEYQERRP